MNNRDKTIKRLEKENPYIEWWNCWTIPYHLKYRSTEDYTDLIFKDWTSLVLSNETFKKLFEIIE